MFTGEILVPLLFGYGGPNNHVVKPIGAQLQRMEKDCLGILNPVVQIPSSCVITAMNRNGDVVQANSIY